MSLVRPDTARTSRSPSPLPGSPGARPAAPCRGGFPGIPRHSARLLPSPNDASGTTLRPPRRAPRHVHRAAARRGEPRGDGDADRDHRRVRRIGARRLRVADDLRGLPPRTPALARALPRERRVHQGPPVGERGVRVQVQERAPRHRGPHRRRGGAPRDALPRPVLLRGRVAGSRVLRAPGAGARVRPRVVPRRAGPGPDVPAPRRREHRRLRPRARPLHRGAGRGRAAPLTRSAGAAGERGAVPDARGQHPAARVERRRARPHPLVQPAVVRVHRPPARGAARRQRGGAHPPGPPGARPRQDPRLLRVGRALGGHLPDPGEGRVVPVVPLAHAPDPRRRGERHPMVRDQHRRHRAARRRAGAAGRGPAEGRVPQRPLPRAAEPARPDPQRGLHPRPRGPRRRADAPRARRHRAPGRSPHEARGRPPRRDADRAREDRAAVHGRGRRERRQAHRRGPAVGRRRAGRRARARAPSGRPSP